MSADGFQGEELLRLAASLEQGSEHPLAEAILAEARRRRLVLVSAEEFDSVTGQGVRGRIDGHDVALGNQVLMETVGADVSPLHDTADGLRQEGASVMYVASDGRLAGAIAVADPIKATT
ncbi:cation-transporting ATPase PacS, partial [Xanthomonas citri pv. citri]